jgi:hypothetical protein
VLKRGFQRTWPIHLFGSASFSLVKGCLFPEDLGLYSLSRAFLLAESPLAFRRRFIFTEAEPLRRAGMRSDGRWWAYETIRSGLTPTAEEAQELAQAGTSAFG